MTKALAIKEELKRLDFLDNLKIVLTCLVVAHHASQGYTNIETGWAVQQTNIPEINDRIIGWFLSIDNAFFMALFFMISAYFIPRSLENRTAKEYIRDRIKRLGIPIIIFMFVIFPVTGYLLHGEGMTFIDFLSRRYFPIPNGEINFGHTWFLFVLLIFTGFYILFVKTRRVQQPNKGKSSSENKTCLPASLKNIHILFFALGLSLLTFFIRIIFKPGYWIPLHAFEPARIITYIAMFGFGIQAYKKQWLSKLPVSVGITWGLISVVVILLAPPVILLLLGGYAIWAEGLSLNSLIVSAWETFLCVGLCVSLPILVRQKLNNTNRILKKAAKYSFGVYLIHPLVIIPIESAVINVPLHPMLKFILTSIVGIIICYSLCHLYSIIRNNLFKKAIRNQG